MKAIELVSLTRFEPLEASSMVSQGPFYWECIVNTFTVPSDALQPTTVLDHR